LRDISAREAFLVDYAQPLLSFDTLNESIIPTETFVPRFIDEVAIAYQYPPDRWIVTKDEKGKAIDDETKTGELNELYKTFDVNSKLNEGYRRANLVNVIAVRPIIYKEKQIEKRNLDLIYPDEFVFRSDASDPHVPEKFMYERNVNGKYYIYVWNADGTNYWRDCDDATIVREFDQYPIIPFAFMRLRDSKDAYGSCEHSLIEGNIKANYREMLNQTNLTFVTGPVGIAINCDLSDGSVLNPRNYIKKDKVLSDAPGMTTRPDFKFVQPNLVVEEVDRVKQSGIKETGKNIGMPDSAFKDSAQVQSGVSRQLERESIYNKRAMHLQSLDKFEHDLWKVIQKVMEVEKSNSKLQDASLEVRVDFTDISEPDDPTKEWELMKEKMESNIISVLDVIEYYNKDVSDAKTAQGILDKNQKENATLKKSGNLFSLISGKKQDG
jgi:hypothetical protein